MNKKLMLLDGNSLINRAFYAMPPLSKGGEPTNAVYGFLNIFVKLYNEERPDCVAAAFDLPAPTFRHKLSAEYKATRKPMPDDLRPQIPALKKLLTLMNISVRELEGFEADDILGTCAKRAEALSYDVCVVSGDRDLLQICSDRIKVRIPKTKAGKTEVEDYYAADLFAALGVTPAEFIEVKALMGDASDNIPGVRGIGEKTAFKIIAEFKSVENALQNLDKISPKKAAENLASDREAALLSRRLAEINTAAPVNFEPKVISREEIFNGLAFEEIKRLNFKSMFRLFESGPVQEVVAPPANRLIIKTAAALRDWIQTIGETSAFVSVTDGDRFLGLAFAEAGAAGFAASFEGGMGEEEIFGLCRPYFEGGGRKICHDLKAEIKRLRRHGIELKNAAFDAALVAYVLETPGGYGLSAIALEYLKESLPSPEDFFGKGKAKTEYTLLTGGVMEEKLLAFACGQAETLLRVYPAMLKALEENGQSTLYHEIEFPLVRVLADMEGRGIKVDRAALSEYGKKLDDMTGILTSEIYLLAGEEFNISSPKQLGVILFEKLGLKAGKKTKTGYSTAADVLGELRGRHEIIDRIIEYRTYTKLKSTYVDGLLAVIEADGKIRSSFNQFATSTGRISSSEPNLQNIPIRYALGRELRKVFIPESDDFIFMDADYSQIELRILAHLSGDETLTAAFRQGEDIHRLTASQVFRTPPDFVTPEQRGNAKAVNFGIVYGISAFSLSQDLGVSVKEAERYIQGYFEKYPKVKVYLEEIVKSAREKGYAETVSGRRRAIPELRAANFSLRSFGERAAMNMPVQGSAADIIKIAMVRVHARLAERGLKSRLLLQVHDELLLEVYKPEAEAVAALLKNEMENAYELDSVLTADVKTGGNWYEAH